jgi:hypothetical protein
MMLPNMYKTYAHGMLLSSCSFRLFIVCIHKAKFIFECRYSLERIPFKAFSFIVFLQREILPMKNGCWSYKRTKQPFLLINI